MNIIINSEEFVAHLTSVVGVVDRKQTMPILGHVLISGQSGEITLTATDLEVQISSSFKANISEDFSITLPGRKLFDILRSLGNTDVEIVSNDDAVILKTAKSKFSLQQLPANEFPLFEKPDGQQVFNMPQTDLASLLNKTQFAMAQQDVRFYLNGLLLEINPESLNVVGTDGHRLAKTNLAIDKKGINEQSCIVPRKAIQELTRSLSDNKECKVSLLDNQASFAFSSIVLTTKLIDGTFPDYNRVIPSETSTNIILDTNILKPALQRVSILANEKFKGVRIDINKDKITISSENPEQEQAVEEIDVEDSGASLSIGFNVSYLIDAVNACKGELVNLGVNDENTSALITDPSDPDTKYVVMPMRL
ncbi:DNA polymerase III subunit beta [Gammaproteobacteria bacterium]|nr:DNA polymerase III subunit beta [Gammaproteobacteria bacterium]